MSKRRAFGYGTAADDCKGRRTPPRGMRMVYQQSGDERYAGKLLAYGDKRVFCNFAKPRKVPARAGGGAISRAGQPRLLRDETVRTSSRAYIP